MNLKCEKAWQHYNSNYTSSILKAFHIQFKISPWRYGHCFHVRSGETHEGGDKRVCGDGRREGWSQGTRGGVSMSKAELGSWGCPPARLEQAGGWDGEKRRSQILSDQKAETLLLRLMGTLIFIQRNYQPMTCQLWCTCGLHYHHWEIDKKGLGQQTSSICQLPLSSSTGDLYLRNIRENSHAFLLFNSYLFSLPTSGQLI